MVIAYAFLLVLVALTTVSLNSLVVLRAASPWTSLGWLSTIAYDLTAIAEILKPGRVPFALPYVFLGMLGIAFIVAGARDEAQAEPWYAPRRLGSTRAERRR